MTRTEDEGTAAMIDRLERARRLGMERGHDAARSLCSGMKRRHIRQLIRRLEAGDPEALASLPRGGAPEALAMLGLREEDETTPEAVAVLNAYHAAYQMAMHKVIMAAGYRT